MEDHGTVEGRKRAPPVQWHWDDLDSVCSLSIKVFTVQIKSQLRRTTNNKT